MSFKLIMVFTKETPSSVTLLTSIVFIDLIVVENSIYWTC